MQNWVNSMKKAGWVKLCFHPFLNPLFLSSVLSCPCTYMYACMHVHVCTHTHVWKKYVPFYYRFHLKLIVLEMGEPKSDKIAKLPDNLPGKSDIYSFVFVFYFCLKYAHKRFLLNLFILVKCSIIYLIVNSLSHLKSSF